MQTTIQKDVVEIEVLDPFRCLTEFDPSPDPPGPFQGPPQKHVSMRSRTQAKERRSRLSLLCVCAINVDVFVVPSC